MCLVHKEVDSMELLHRLNNSEHWAMKQKENVHLAIASITTLIAANLANLT